MGIYLFVTFICVLLGFMEMGVNRNPKYRYADLYFYTAVLLLLYVIAGFRECGFDYYNYKGYFQELNGPNWLSEGLKIGSEPGFSWLNYALGNYAAVIAVMSAAILTVQSVFLWRYCKLPILSLVFYLGLFMYPSTMGQFRQALSIGIVLWAVVNRDNRTKFFMLILLAMMFHFSAILGILALFVPRHYKTLKFYLTAFALALLCSASAQVVYLRLIDLLPAYVATKLSHYASVETAPLGLNTTVLLRAFVFFLCYHYRQKLSGIPRMEYFLNIYFLSLFIYTAFGFAPQVAGRGSIYFSFFEIILIADLVYALKGWQKYLVFGLFVGFSLYRQISFFGQWSFDYIPYKNWLFSLF